MKTNLELGVMALIQEHHSEDVIDRRDLAATPARFVKALTELLSGYDLSPRDILSKTFAAESDGLVLVRDIPFVSLCEHHMLPFTGTVDVAYIPDGKVVGLSKIPRATQARASRLQIQERLTHEIAHDLWETVLPRGVMVVVRSQHSCACLRGVKAVGSSMVTSEMLGCFKTDAALRAEVLSLMGQSK